MAVHRATGGKEITSRRMRRLGAPKRWTSELARLGRDAGLPFQSCTRCRLMPGHADWLIYSRIQALARHSTKNSFTMAACLGEWLGVLYDRHQGWGNGP